MSAQERLTLRNAYLYLVCLITLVIAVFAAVQLVRAAVSLAYPDPGWYGYAPEPVDGAPSEEEQRRQQELAEDSQRRHAVLELVGSGTTLLIAGPLYVYHWRRVQSELPHRTGGDAPAPTGP
jgi:hypothetical protein